MKTRYLIPIIFVFFLLLSFFSSVSLKGAYETPQTPAPVELIGTGSSLDVYEFVQNHSATFYNAKNNTIFSYLVNWFPTSYRGYHLFAEIQNVRKTTNPVPNGDFELYTEPGNNWTLIDDGTGLISSISNISGGNPGSCLDVELANDKLLLQRNALIENSFEYTSALPPDHLTLYFDIRFSSDITVENWLIIEVSIETSFGSTVANWITTTADYHPTTWNTISVPSVPVNGSLTLHIEVIKSTTSNLDVDGHIYFDNFNYQIGSYATPSEVGLSLNGTDVEDTFGNYGEVNVYADPVMKEEVNLSKAWDTSLLFIFNSSFSISFDFEYIMAMKNENLGAAQTGYVVKMNQNPLWTINYTIPSGRPPPGFSNYQYGFYLQYEWQIIGVRDSLGLIVMDYTYNASSRFFLLNKAIASPGDRFTVYAQSNNHVIDVYIQKSVSAEGPWENVTTDDFVLTGEYIRVIGSLGSISASGNSGVISVLLPNGTIWKMDSNPTFNPISNTVTSEIWQTPAYSDESSANDYTAIVSFSSGTQSGLRNKTFKTMNQAQILLVTPFPNSTRGWEDFEIIVFIQDTTTEEYITEAEVRLRYLNPQGQNQSVIMSLNEQGAYFTRFSPTAYGAYSSIDFFVEFYKQGYVNATYNQGTARQINIIVNAGIHPQAAMLNQIIVFSISLAIIILSLWLLYSKGYRQRYSIPKQQAHEKKLQEVLTIYNDVTNLSRFLVLHRGSGIAIFDSLGERARDGSLIGGFLQAIQAFSLDVDEVQKPKETAQLSEITYEGFRVLINDGQHVRTAIVYRGTPSATLHEKLNLFTQKFEERYEQELLLHGHEPQRFQAANDFLEEIFHISLLYPHKVKLKTGDITLTTLESRLHFVALELVKEHERIFLSEIVSTYLETIQQNPLEVLNGIFQLREKGLLTPIENFNAENSLARH